MSKTGALRPFLVLAVDRLTRAQCSSRLTGEALTLWAGFLGGDQTNHAAAKPGIYAAWRLRARHL